MTDKLQLMLINVLLDQFLNTKVSQGSVHVATHLRCDGILNDQFITKSLLSQIVKKMKIGQYLPKLWAIRPKYQVVFLWNTVYLEFPTLTADKVLIINGAPYGLFTDGQSIKLKILFYPS